jgi:hypothetical protein
LNEWKAALYGAAFALRAKSVEDERFCALLGDGLHPNEK